MGQRVNYIAKSSKGWTCGKIELPKQESIIKMWLADPVRYHNDSGEILDLLLKQLRGEK
jgi:hypothetical protein